METIAAWLGVIAALECMLIGFAAYAAKGKGCWFRTMGAMAGAGSALGFLYILLLTLDGQTQNLAGIEPARVLIFFLVVNFVGAVVIWALQRNQSFSGTGSAILKPIGCLVIGGGLTFLLFLGVMILASLAQ